MRVLLIEDDATLGGAIRDQVVADTHSVDWVQTIADAAAASEVVDYGLILLDLQLPDGDGTGFLAALRRGGSHVPVIILTARDQISDRIAGLNSGADDYLVKPFDLQELSARILAVARRYSGSPGPTFRLAGLEIDRAHRRILGTDGAVIDLTAREWAVLDCLAARPGAIVSKAQIEEALYAFGSEVESNTVEVYVSRLRKKIGADAVATIRGVGYRMAVS